MIELSVKYSRQTIPTIAGVSTVGMIKTVMIKLAPQRFRYRSEAKVRPRRNSKVTLPKQKTKVRPRALKRARLGLVKIQIQLLRPVNSAVSHGIPRERR